MIINLNADGEVLEQEYTEIVQGDNNANKIYVIAPFAKNAVLNLSFECPNGFVTQNYLMTRTLEISKELNIWERSIVDIPITEYYGLVKYQIKATIADKTIAVARGKFKVQEGVDWQLPQEPTETIYEDILSALNSIDGKFINKVDINYTSFDNSVEQEIINNQNGLILKRAKDGVTHSLDFEDDGIKYNGIELGTVDDVANALQEAKDYTYSKSQIDEKDASILSSAKQYGENFVKDYTYSKDEINAKDTGILNTSKADNITDINNHNVSSTAHPDIRSKISNVDEKYDRRLQNYYNKTQVNELISGVQKLVGYVFDTYAQFINWLNGEYERLDGLKPSNLIIGNEILLKETDTPDYWVSSISDPMTINDFSPLEGKIDLTDYITKNEQDYLIVSGEPTDASIGKMIYENISSSPITPQYDSTNTSTAYGAPQNLVDKYNSGSDWTVEDIKNLDWLGMTADAETHFWTFIIPFDESLYDTLYSNKNKALKIKAKINGVEQEFTVEFSGENENAGAIWSAYDESETWTFMIQTYANPFLLGGISGLDEPPHIPSVTFAGTLTDVSILSVLTAENTVIWENAGSSSFSIDNLKIADGTQYKSVKNLILNDIDLSLYATKTYVNDAVEDKITNNFLNLTIATTSWQDLTGSEIFKYKVTVDSPYQITTTGNAIYELINDNPNNFATYGFALNDVSFGTPEIIYSKPKLTFYAIKKPTTSVTLKVEITANSVSLINPV